MVAFGAPLAFGSALRAVRGGVHRIPALAALVVSGLALIAISIGIVLIALHTVFPFCLE
jgi:hypothetical protein